VIKYGDAAQRAKTRVSMLLRSMGPTVSHLRVLSPFSNGRDGSYAGASRTGPSCDRVLHESGARRKDFPIFFRIPARHVPGGLSEAETPLIARMMEKAGVDGHRCFGGKLQIAEWIVAHDLAAGMQRRRCGKDQTEG